MAGDRELVERFTPGAARRGRLGIPTSSRSTRPAGRRTYFLAMKYVEGSTLRQVASSGASRCFRPSSDTSPRSRPHSTTPTKNSIIHRDIKPGNMLVDSDGGVLLTDFGIAQAAEDINVTSQGMLVGTPACMCPDKPRDSPPLPNPSVYALGVVVYRC
ncbi:MAG: protein kinase [Thermomicrobiales bacterium]